MKYIINFAKHISFVGWMLYLIKFIIDDFIPDKLFGCIMAIIFTMIFYSLGIVENMSKNK